jgi:integrase
MVDSGYRKATLGYGMAVCTYTRKDSPYFWLQWGQSDNRTNQSSGVRLGDPDADFKLAKAINKIEAKMLVRHCGAGWDWVPVFFRAAYTNTDTLRIHMNAWNYLAAYFREREIKSPEQLTTRQDVFDYLEWRTSQIKQKSRRSPARNTALYEMRVLGRVMDEAVLRDMAEKNPAANLRLKRDAPKPKPEILEEQQPIILDALRKKPRWMQRSFRIALQTGLRFSETIIDLRQNVDWNNAEITVPDPKGGHVRAFTFGIVQMSLVPYLRTIDERYTWSRSEIGPTPAGVVWRRFFDDLGMPDISFHCTRTTFITWCYRQFPPIPAEIVMKLVNHADEEIHRIYRRLTAADVRPWRDRVIDPYVARIAR